MAKFERDPITCQERINKRRELLAKLHEENLQILINPSKQSEFIDEMAEKECNHPECLLNKNAITTEQMSKVKFYNFITILLCLITIFMLTILAVFIGRVGN